MPARPRGLLEPCAATSGPHGSEEGGAGKRHPLSDNNLHYVRDVTFDEDRSQVRTGSAPQVMATLRTPRSPCTAEQDRPTVSRPRWFGTSM